METTDVNNLIELLECSDETTLAEIDKRIGDHSIAIEKLRRVKKMLGGPQKKTGSKTSHSGPRVNELVTQLLSKNGGQMPLATVSKLIGKEEMAVRMVAVKCPHLVSISGNIVSLVQQALNAMA